MSKKLSIKDEEKMKKKLFMFITTIIFIFTGNVLLNAQVLLGYNYLYKIPIGATFGKDWFQASLNMSFGDLKQIEWVAGISIPAHRNLRIPIGLGFNHKEYIENDIDTSGWEKKWDNKFVINVGLQPVISDTIFFSGTYRLIGFNKSSFSLGIGFILDDSSNTSSTSIPQPVKYYTPSDVKGQG